MLTKISQIFFKKNEAEIEQALSLIPRSWSTPTNASGPKVLFYESVNEETVLAQMLIIRAYIEAGYCPWVFISENSKTLVPLYQAMGVNEFCYREEFDGSTYRALNDEFQGSIHSQNDLLLIEYQGVRVGKYVASSMMRKTRSGKLDMTNPMVREEAFKLLRKSLGAMAVSEQVLEKVNPSAVIFNDYGYTPMGELFDLAAKANIPVYTWIAGHRYSTLILKRLANNNIDMHPVSLSDHSWQEVLSRVSEEDISERVLQEISDSYGSGEWYAEVGTQVNKEKKSTEWLVNEFSLDPEKKVALIFPHLFWDATFFWGKDLFADYEEWFTEVIRVAIENEHVNWLIKVHPSNIVKNRRDGYEGEYSEIEAINKITDQLPAHIKLIPADSGLSTLSLFPLMDYCLTVRGTVGIESAIFGARVLTAGTGRYDRRGFTMDFDDKESYLEALKKLHLLERMSEKEIFRAQAYAYGLFLLRPLKTNSIQLSWSKNTEAKMNVEVDKKSLAEGNGEDLQQLKEYILSEKEDYLFVS